MNKYILCPISKILKCVFLGYASHQKGYLYFEPGIQHIRIYCNVVFFENQYFFQQHPGSGTSHSISVLLDFYDSSIVTRFKLGLVYVQQNTQDNEAPGHLSLLLWNPTQELVLIPLCFGALSRLLTHLIAMVSSLPPCYLTFCRYS